MSIFVGELLRRFNKVRDDMKKGYREAENAWEGCDGREYVYNDAEEKQYESTVWKYLAVGSILLFLLVIYSHFLELRVVWQGTCIEAVYEVKSNGEEIARYVDADGKLYLYNVSGMDSVHTEDIILLYYLDDIDEAIPKTGWKQWFWYYLIFGCLGSLSIWKICRIYKRS